MVGKLVAQIGVLSLPLEAFVAGASAEAKELGVKGYIGKALL